MYWMRHRSWFFSFFFFSSRRRHTRFDCDWSSDVCSSDLDRDGRPVRLGRRGDARGTAHRTVLPPRRDRGTLLPHPRFLHWLTEPLDTRSPARPVSGRGHSSGDHVGAGTSSPGTAPTGRRLPQFGSPGPVWRCHLCAVNEINSEIDVGRLVLQDRKSTRLNSSHSQISYAVF